MCRSTRPGSPCGLSMQGQKMSQPALDGRGDPGFARRRRGPDEAAVPWGAGRHARLAGVGDAQGGLLSGRQRAGQGDRQPPLRVGPAVGGNLDPVHLHRGDGQKRIQLDRQPVQRGRRGEVQHGDGVDGLVGGNDPDRQIGLVEPHRPLFRRERLVGGQGEAGRFARRRGRRPGRGRASRQGGQGREAGGGEQGLDAHRTFPFGLATRLARPGRRAKKKAGVSTGLSRIRIASQLRRRPAQPAWREPGA